MRLPVSLLVCSCVVFAMVPWAVSAGEAPVPEVSATIPAPAPLPTEAEAAYQDLLEGRRQDIWLDEAVFTEISPLSIPEIGIALPPDQLD